MQTAVLGGGCFWCTEAIYQRLKGVEFVESGYAGGIAENPTYGQVVTGKTGHTESVKITFDPAVLSYKKLLEVFFATHDPTTFDRQLYDVGREYRSVIFYMDDGQKKIAEDLITELQPKYSQKIVTKVEPYKNFYKAENYEQNYYNTHPDKPYCQIIIGPKLEHFKDQFKDLTV